MKKAHTIHFPNKKDAIDVVTYLIDNEVPYSYASEDCKHMISFSNKNDYLAIIRYSMNIGA